VLPGLEGSKTMGSEEVFESNLRASKGRRFDGLEEEMIA
jgi:hypothetical protein